MKTKYILYADDSEFVMQSGNLIDIFMQSLMHNKCTIHIVRYNDNEDEYEELSRKIIKLKCIT
jgi:hypothetical protein